MYFKKIDMHGFKSFADPVTIEFNQGLTGIVGPNGSGKSNISDAIRWVLGEQSPKTLRGGKMEEVIFSGTDSRKSRGMAEVTLVIDNSDESLPIDYKEVAITRRMFRSGESEYYINGNQCRLCDIRELIMDTGIGVDGYSLIGQGKIADIISNKIESRREIFEEAAGIVAYRTKKAESERKLAELQKQYAYFDAMTGLRNRRAYEEKLLQLAKDAPPEFCIVMADINGLKQTNDTIGHDAGDELITAASKCLTDAFEGIDTIYRIGGDEFCIIMNGSIEKADLCLARLTDLTAHWNGRYISSISISTGVASNRDHDSIDSMTAEADQKMYECKRYYYMSSGQDRRRY